MRVSLARYGSVLQGYHVLDHLARCDLALAEPEVELALPVAPDLLDRGVEAVVCDGRREQIMGTLIFSFRHGAHSTAAELSWETSWVLGLGPSQDGFAGFRPAVSGKQLADLGVHGVATAGPQRGW